MRIYWKVKDHLRKVGIENVYQLSTRAVIGYPAAERIMGSGADEPITRIDTGTLFALATLFGVDDPLALLEVRPAPRQRR